MKRHHDPPHEQQLTRPDHLSPHCPPCCQLLAPAVARRAGTGAGLFVVVLVFLSCSQFPPCKQLLMAAVGSAEMVAVLILHLSFTVAVIVIAPVVHHTIHCEQGFAVVVWA